MHTCIIEILYYRTHIGWVTDCQQLKNDLILTFYVKHVLVIYRRHYK